MPFQLLWENYSQRHKRVFSKKWTHGARAYIRGSHAGRPYFQSLETRDRRIAQRLFLERQAKIIEDAEPQKIDVGRCNFAYAVLLYFGACKPEEKDAKGRVSKIFDLIAEKFLDDITQADLDALAVKLRPKSSGSTREREVYTPFISVYNAAVKHRKAAPRRWRRPECSRNRIPINQQVEKKIAALIEVASANVGRNKEKAARNKAAILMVSMLGAPASSVTKLLWSDIDFEGSLVRFTRGRNRKERIVLLPPLLVEALKTLAAFGSKPEDRVFGWKTRLGLKQMIAHARTCAGSRNTPYRPIRASMAF